MSKSKKSEKGPVDSTIDHEIESNEVENTAAEEIASEEKPEPTVEEQLTQEIIISSTQQHQTANFLQRL